MICSALPTGRRGRDRGAALRRGLCRIANCPRVALATQAGCNVRQRTDALMSLAQTWNEVWGHAMAGQTRPASVQEKEWNHEQNHLARRCRRDHLVRPWVFRFALNAHRMQGRHSLQCGPDAGCGERWGGAGLQRITGSVAFAAMLRVAPATHEVAVSCRAVTASMPSRRRRGNSSPI